MAVFGFLSGLPLPLSAFTLQQWFTTSGISAATVGTTTLLGLAYTLKFLWAPLFDQLPPGPLARFGRRRGWLLLVQPALALAVLTLAHSTPAATPVRTAIAAAMVAFLSASQDILIDSWRIEIFPERLQGAALAATIWGYRAALLVSGAATLWVAARIGWPAALTALAIILAAGVLATLLAPAPAHMHRAPHKNFVSAILAPLAEFLSRPGARRILAFVVLFRLGKVFADTMAAPYYHAVGFAQQTIAIANFLPGLAGTLLGAAAGGTLVAALGTRRALFATGAAQAASLALYLMLLATGPYLLALSTKVALENFCGTAADAAFLTFISALCARAHTASQYALLSSLAALALHTIGGTSGFVAETLGWPAFYALTLALSLPALAVLLTMPRVNRISDPPQTT